MPLGLLLQLTLGPLMRGSGGLGVLDQSMRLETALLARARGAFLTHWFGNRLPQRGNRLVVAIANIEELGRRYREVRMARHGGMTGPNLLDPLASLLGTAGGILMSPTGGILFLFVMAMREMHGVLAGIVGLIWGWLMSAIFSLLGFGAIAIAAVAAPFVGLITSGGGLSILPAIYEVASATGRCVAALSALLDQLTGPRERVRNPLLRQILLLADHFAGLVGQIVGATVLLFARIGPRLGGIVRTFLALGELGSSVGELLGEVWSGAAEAFRRLYSNRGNAPWAIVLQSIDVVQRLLFAALSRVELALHEVLLRLLRRVVAVIAALTAIITAQIVVVSTAVATHPVMQSIAVSIRQVRAVSSAFSSMIHRRPAPPSSGPSTSSGSFMSGLIARALRFLRLPTALPPMPTLPDAEQIIRDLGGRPATPTPSQILAGATSDPSDPNAWVFSFDLATRERIERLMRTPASAFAGERARLSAERSAETEIPGGATLPFEQALRQREMQLRGLIETIVGRILPGQARTFLPQLQEMLDRLDARLHPAPGQPGQPERRELPVRDLPDNGQLRPVVRRLTVRGPAARTPELRAFANDIRKLMQGQTYLAPAGG